MATDDAGLRLDDAGLGVIAVVCSSAKSLIAVVCPPALRAGGAPTSAKSLIADDRDLPSGMTADYPR
jgi:hypothetical protein